MSVISNIVFAVFGSQFSSKEAWKTCLGLFHPPLQRSCEVGCESGLLQDHSVDFLCWHLEWTWKSRRSLHPLLCYSVSQDSMLMFIETEAWLPDPTTVAWFAYSEALGERRMLFPLVLHYFRARVAFNMAQEHHSCWCSDIQHQPSPWVSVVLPPPSAALLYHTRMCSGGKKHCSD